MMKPVSVTSKALADSRLEGIDKEWVSFPGGELEGRRPRVCCPACQQRSTPARALCFQCYRAHLDRERAVKCAGEIDTANDARFEWTKPFEPVNRHRLEMLRAQRAAARAKTSPFVQRRRQAQIEARHALAGIAAGLRARELRLPDAWLPFVKIG